MCCAVQAAILNGGLMKKTLRLAGEGTKHEAAIIAAQL
jgi:hypothetical protein